jgi:hypothetical protein
MATRRTKAAPVAIDGGGLAVFYVDCQLAAFPTLPFHEAMKAKPAEGAIRALPSNLAAHYTLADELKLTAWTARFRALSSEHHSDASEQRAAPLASHRLYRRVNYSTSLKHHFQTACPV